MSEKGELSQGGRWIECLGKQAGHRQFGNRFFVVGNGEAAFRDVEDALGGAAVAFWIVQDALLNAVGIDDVRTEMVAAGGEGQGTGNAVAVEDQGEVGQVWDLGEVEVVEIFR